jgi:hypothetical protein
MVTPVVDTSWLNGLEPTEPRESWIHVRSICVKLIYSVDIFLRTSKRAECYIALWSALTNVLRLLATRFGSNWRWIGRVLRLLTTGVCCLCLSSLNYAKLCCMEFVCLLVNDANQEANSVPTNIGQCSDYDISTSVSTLRTPAVDSVIKYPTVF